MFNIGPGELMAIAAVALIVLGPQRLPQALRSVGRVVGELRRISGGFQDELRRAIDESDATPEVEPVVDITEGRPAASATGPSGTGGTADAAPPSSSGDDDEPHGMLLPTDTPDPDVDRADADGTVDTEAVAVGTDHGRESDGRDGADKAEGTEAGDDPDVEPTGETVGHDDAVDGAEGPDDTDAAGGGQRAVS